MSQRPIIVKKIKKIEGGHHGGAWKVAYADFVTAMMAFFLLMWLLNATSEEQRSGLADYFDPKIPISQNSAGGMNMFNGDSVFSQEKLARSGLGGSGKQAAAGRDENQRHEVANSADDVWSKAQKEQELIGNKISGNADFELDDPNVSLVNDEKVTAKEIEDKIKDSFEAIDTKGLIEHLNFKMTDEGLRIDITDGKDNPMFLSGSDRPSDRMKKIMAVVGNVLSVLKNDISITGHTDSVPIKSKRNYSNWELSSDRANASRRELIDAGIKIDRIKRIEGRADTQPFIKDDPENSQNRRIGIILLRDNSFNAMKAKVAEAKKEELKAKEAQIEAKSKVQRNSFPTNLGSEQQDTQKGLVPDPLAFE